MSGPLMTLVLLVALVVYARTLPPIPAPWVVRGPRQITVWIDRKAWAEACRNQVLYGDTLGIEYTGRLLPSDHPDAMPLTYTEGHA